MHDRFHTLAVRALLYALAGAVLLWPAARALGAPPRLLDGFENAGDWKVVASTQVSGTLRAIDGVEGRALCLDFDFHGVSGYVGIRRALPLDYPADYAFEFKLRGEAPANNLEFKLVDASGDNVWWVQRPMRVFTPDWETVRYRKRHVSKAWGPAPDTELKHSESLEFTLASGSGGKGSVCFDQLRFTPLQPDDGSPLTTARSTRNDALVLDLGRAREFGGLSLKWPRRATLTYQIDVSDDARGWRPLKLVKRSDGGEDWIALPETESRYLRVSGAPGGLVRDAQGTVEPLAFGASTNAFLQEVAKRAPRGEWPRGFNGEQPYWTLVGIDGGHQQALISEDGAIELGKGGPSVEPFVVVDGQRFDWTQVRTAQSLQDGYLPLPGVQWRHAGFDLDIGVYASGEPGSSALQADYRLVNTSNLPHRYQLQLALRPLQVNPPSQFLNTSGGYAPICRTGSDDRTGFGIGAADGAGGPGREWTVRFGQPPSLAAAYSFAGGDLAAPEWVAVSIDNYTGIEDPDCLAGLVWRYDVELKPNEAREFSWTAALEGALAAKTAARQSVIADWHRKLDAVRFTVPPQGRHMIETLRYALATMLISRSGPRLQPGTRSYARAWIRDGAMIDEALLRLGREDVARDFVDWYAPYQFKDGKVPCCVDDRGSDPVPENDSHGELVYAIAEVYRYTKDRAWLQAQWPHVLGAVAYMDQLRASERTQANRAKNPAFYGLLPASISHEGYSAKPMHSYWDDFWALRGYKDALRIASWLGKEEDAKRITAARDQFAGDLRASLAAATTSKVLDFIPGSAELGDFDPTSTTIALAPADAADLLPPGLLLKTFERYWRQSQARAQGTRAWKDYTPYELRTVGTFVRLGQPERAQAMLEFFFRGQQPAGWRQWAEVVSGTPRKPFFLGDLPHAWVASDYVRSVLDLFAYERGERLVLAGGLPPDWLDGEGVSIEGLRTPYGVLTYSIRREGQTWTLELQGDAPPGGFVLALPHAKVRAASIDGRAATAEHDELEIARAPASVRVEFAD